MTPEQRADLKTELDAIDAAEAPLVKIMEPYKAAINGLEHLRDVALCRYGVAERPPTCEGCECFILPGDMYHSCLDGELLCEECSPTIGNMIDQLKEPADNSRGDEDLAEEAETLLILEARVAAGESLDTKLVSEYQL